MTHDIEPIHADQSRIVRELFVDTADDNYVAARWCFVEGLNVDYLWLGVHALEKYMKAALLLNGRSGKGYLDGDGKLRHFGHDIVALYECVKAFASDLLPNNLAQPGGLELGHWRDEEPEDFVRRLYRDGNADNRYQLFGFVQHREDLFKLDTMVFALRRLCVPLDAYYLSRHHPGTRNPTHRDILTDQADWWTVSSTCKLEKTADGKRGGRLRDMLLSFNFPFAPKDYAHGRLRIGTASHNPVLARSILNPLERSLDNVSVARAAELCDWVLENIKLPKDVEVQLREAGRTARLSGG